LAETFIESRYQWYQEDRNRIEVDSNYSLFGLDLNDATAIDGSFLYSAISGASPTGLPPLFKGGPVPLAHLTDQRYAFTLGLTRQLANHALRGGFAYSYEGDYSSYAYSLQDTIFFNQKTTELVLGLAYTDDIVGANGLPLRASKRSWDGLIGLNQILGPNDLLSVNFTFSRRDGYLADPYKRVLFNQFSVFPDHRPAHRREELVFVQWTHYLPFLHASVETSYRFGKNDWGSHSHTAQLAVNQKLFGDRLVISPHFRYYRQSAADFYDTEFTGAELPRYYSADYRLSAEETFTAGLQIRWQILKDRLALDAGYDRYITRARDNKTPDETYPDAHEVSVGFHYQF
jgi:hypothetical protein